MAWEDIEARYYEFLQERGYIEEQSGSSVLDIYLEYVVPDSDVLDFGCGRGEFLEGVREKGCRAFGVDSDSKMVAICRGKGFEVAHEDGLTFLEAVEPESYDFIFCSNVIEHMRPVDVVQLLDLSYRALRPGGKALLATPNPESMIVHLYEFWRDATHVRLYNRQLLEFLLWSSGYSPVETGTNPATAWKPKLSDTDFDWLIVDENIEDLSQRFDPDAEDSELSVTQAAAVGTDARQIQPDMAEAPSADLDATASEEKPEIAAPDHAETDAESDSPSKTTATASEKSAEGDRYAKPAPQGSADQGVGTSSPSEADVKSDPVEDTPVDGVDYTPVLEPIEQIKLELLEPQDLEEIMMTYRWSHRVFLKRLIWQYHQLEESVDRLTQKLDRRSRALNQNLETLHQHMGQNLEILRQDMDHLTGGLRHDLESWTQGLANDVAAIKGDFEVLSSNVVTWIEGLTGNLKELQTDVEGRTEALGKEIEHLWRELDARTVQLEKLMRKNSLSLSHDIEFKTLLLSQKVAGTQQAAQDRLYHLEEAVRFLYPHREIYVLGEKPRA